MEATDGVLQKVRALLAKAEATTFEAEAESFTAKAQELIARHRIDQALLERDTTRTEPVARRVAVDDPYLVAKIALLSQVASANDCRAVWPKPQRFVHVFGFAGDLDAVEELFTALLVQATTAMLHAGSKRDAVGRNRTKAFRRAFLLSFAQRIGERLRETVAATVETATAESGGALVPLLAARAEAVEALSRRSFPDVAPVRASVVDREGWYAGARCAEAANLSVSRKLGRSA